MGEPYPAFLFYPRDWLSSSSVSGMSLAEQGAYHRLLCYQWQDGSLPDDDVKLAKLLNIPVNRWRKMVSVRSKFENGSVPGQIQNSRLERVRSEREQWLQRQVESGRKGAARRWGAHKGRHRQPIKTPMAKNGLPSASSDTPSKGVDEGAGTVSPSSAPAEAPSLEATPPTPAREPTAEDLKAAAETRDACEALIDRVNSDIASNAVPKKLSTAFKNASWHMQFHKSKAAALADGSEPFDERALKGVENAIEEHCRRCEIGTEEVW